jgi:CheY-like chemotaxis protein
MNDDKDPDQKNKRHVFDDWMVRISFAEAGAPDTGFEVTGLDVVRKSKLALEKIMVVRSERATGAAGEPATGADAAAAGGVRKGDSVDEASKIRVMILDDEPIVAKRLGPALEKHGFAVEAFVEPREALARLEEHDFDIVVTDLRMEEVDGIQVLEHIMSSCPNTRVILITGYATVEVAREALVKGAFDFIAKPFKPKDLRAVLNKAALSLGHTGIA